VHLFAEYHTLLADDRPSQGHFSVEHDTSKNVYCIRNYFVPRLAEIGMFKDVKTKHTMLLL